MPTKIIEVEIKIIPVPALTPATRPRRWKVQRRVDIYARDRSDKRFLFATAWHTVSEVDKLATAEHVRQWVRREDPDHEFRIAEEWPIGSEVREHK